MDRQFMVDVSGKINNIKPFKSNALLPLYEAIVNSINSIDRSRSKPIIKVELLYERGIDSGSKTIKNISITDYGGGFNDSNLNSFLTSDSTYNKDYGCKGIGRFTWLCAFEKVRITSVYEDGCVKRVRKFEFMPNKPFIKMDYDGDIIDEDVSTTVELLMFKNEYKRLPTAYKKTKTIAEKIMLHCFAFMMANKELEIQVIDEEGTESCREIFNELENPTTDEFVVDGENFTLIHVKMPEDINDSTNQLLFCGNNRVVERQKIDYLGKDPLLSGNSKFYYAGFIHGSKLDEALNQSRTGFSIADESNLDSFGEINMTQIKKAAMAFVEKYLSESLKAIKDNKELALNQYLKKYPEYGPICYKNRDAILNKIKVTSSLEEIYYLVNEHEAKQTYASKETVQKILNTDVDKCMSNLDEVIDKEMNNLNIENMTNLSKGVVRRNEILKLIDKKLQYIDGGEKYSKEEVIHDLIFPRHNYSRDVPIDNCNLWIIDERLMYHSFAVSDKPLKEYTDLDSKNRPDIMIALTKEHSRSVDSICIVEFKRPMLNTVSNSPIDQMLKYVKEMRESKKVDKNGRNLNIKDTTLYFCYALCDMSEAICDDAEIRGFQKFPDDLGYYQYHPNYNAYVEVISYDKLLSKAYMNNYFMFEKLGLQIPDSLNPTK